MNREYNTLYLGIGGIRTPILIENWNFNRVTSIMNTYFESNDVLYIVYGRKIVAN